MAGRGLNVLVGIACTILIAGAVYLGGDLIAPVAFALFLMALVWPLQAALQRRLPPLLALFLTLGVTLVVLGFLFSLTLWGFGRAAQWLIANAGRFQTLYADAAGWLEGHGLVIAGSIVETFNVSWMIRFLQSVAARLNGMLGFAVLTGIYMMLGLLEVDVIRRKLAAGEAGENGRRVLAACVETGAKLRRYMGVRTVVSLCTGAAVWGFATLAGLELAVAWGVIAFVLNYIPFIGPLLATLMPTLFTMVQFESWQMALVVFAGMNIIQFLSGSYIEPRIAGRAVAVSPFIVLLAVFAGAFMWGLAGAFIGVPVVIAALTLCEHYEGSRWVARLLSGTPPAVT